MIPVANIKNIMSTLATELGITIIRGDQQGQHPAYPYATYKEIISNEESAHQYIKEVEENALDPTSVDIKTYNKSEAMYSFNFLDKNRIDRIKQHATNALKWFNSIEGREYCVTQEIRVLIISPVIDDRTIYQQAFFENKIGFDLRFDYTGLETETIEAIEEINIGVTRDGVQQDDIEITIP
jgi:hypothetical protein